MLYRNKKTGVIVDVQSEVSGDWEAVKPPVPVSAPVEKAEKAPEVKKSAKPRKTKK